MDTLQLKLWGETFPGTPAHLPQESNIWTKNILSCYNWPHKNSGSFLFRELIAVQRDFLLLVSKDKEINWVIQVEGFDEWMKRSLVGHKGKVEVSEQGAQNLR